MNRTVVVGAGAIGLLAAYEPYTPFRDALRVAGTVEITSLTAGATPRRIAAIRMAASRYLKDWAAGTGQVEWMGMRPLLPDSLPAIGRAPGFENVYVATGHGMNGITLAPVTGAVIADLMVRGRTDLDLTPFDPSRFVRKPEWRWPRHALGI